MKTSLVNALLLIFAYSAKCATVPGTADYDTNRVTKPFDAVAYMKSRYAVNKGLTAASVQVNVLSS